MSYVSVMAPTVTLTPRGVERAKSGHLWIYRSDLADVQAAGGDVVQVVGPRGPPVGEAFYSDRSQIAIRLVSQSGATARSTGPAGTAVAAAATGPGAASSGALWRHRLEQAIRFASR